MTQAAEPSDRTGSDSPDETVLEVRHLTKRFPVGSPFRPQYVHALTDASFTIARRQVVALVGESGSGKSTTARLVARLMPPTSGEILLHGRSVLEEERRKASATYRKSVQMIFQDPFGSLNPVHTIGHAIERPIVVLKKAGRGAREEVLDLLTTVGLTPPHEVEARYPYELSGGQRQRVAIARALGVEPEIILADEPVSMLDVSIRMGILNLMERLKEERGIGFLYITHDLASARYIGDRTIVMYAGHMVEEAESTELMEQPAHPYTQLLLSAVPNPQAGLVTSDEEVRGEIPSLIDPPPGCPFAPRCPHAMSVCREVMPGREYVNADHWVRCHLYGPGEMQDAAGAAASPPAGATS
ncbi:MAG: ABC transporter ATP-binding protein [Chloroflexi bacterium]|nr:ABC transporter ATP-binding protein [Chloroflexota bacterium]